MTLSSALGGITAPCFQNDDRFFGCNFFQYIKKIPAILKVFDLQRNYLGVSIVTQVVLCGGFVDIRLVAQRQNLGEPHFARLGSGKRSHAVSPALRHQRNAAALGQTQTE